MKKIRSILCLILIICMGIIFVGCDKSEVQLPSNPNAPTREQLLADIEKDREAALQLCEKDYGKVTIDKNFDFDGISNYVRIDVKDYGSITLLLRPDVAPKTVNNFKKLALEGFYDGLIFHRAIKGLMIEGGEQDTDHVIHDSDMIYGEFADNNFTNNLPHIKGVISMSRKNIPDSAMGSFFIVCDDAPQLDSRYAAFGYVIDGMDTVEKIESAEVGSNHAPLSDIVIEKIVFLEIGE